MSFRAIQALKEADYVLAEDTRRSSILLNHYGIQKKLTSYHKFKEKHALASILQDLQEGKILALLSDAGTPCISDPGQSLIEACIQKGIVVQAVPGPCSLIQALVLSGFSFERFQFIGFLPKKSGALLKATLSYPGPTVAFESPERLVKTLALIDPEREVAVLREMTKMFEECVRGKVKKLREHFQNHPPKGEIVIVVGPGAKKDEMSVEETIQMLMQFHGLSLKEAIRQAARLKGLPKRKVYGLTVKKKGFQIICPGSETIEEEPT